MAYAAVKHDCFNTTLIKTISAHTSLFFSFLDLFVVVVVFGGATLFVFLFLFYVYKEESEMTHLSETYYS